MQPTEHEELHGLMRLFPGLLDLTAGQPSIDGWNPLQPSGCNLLPRQSTSAALIIAAELPGTGRIWICRDQLGRVVQKFGTEGRGFERSARPSGRSTPSAPEIRCDIGLPAVGGPLRGSVASPSSAPGGRMRCFLMQKVGGASPFSARRAYIHMKPMLDFLAELYERCLRRNAA